MTNKRLLNTLGKKDNINLTEVIQAKFSVGSKHQCRVLDFNHLSNTYICTPEVTVVKENLFSPKDLTVGQKVDVTILAVKDEGFVVTTGHIRGFIPNLHISNSEATVNIRRTFKVGQKLPAR